MLSKGSKPIFSEKALASPRKAISRMTNMLLNAEDVALAEGLVVLMVRGVGWLVRWSTMYYLPSIIL